MKKRLLFSIVTLTLSTSLWAQSNSEYATERFFEKIKKDPQQLFLFLQSMPKGGDLHNHHGGASMAENMIQYAIDDHLCLDRANFRISLNEKCKKENLLENSVQDSALYNAVIDAWSMRFFVPEKESGHDHFFGTFFKYYPIVDAHTSEILAEIVERAAEQNELYVELLMTSENNLASEVGKQVGWNADFAVMRDKLLVSGLPQVIEKISNNLATDETKYKKILQCDSAQAKPGCHLKVRYQYLALREQPPEQVFAQLLTGFELANKDSKVVGVNMVQAEDGMISMRDYKLHMQMVRFLHSLYPKVHISLHAGELSSALVPIDALHSHIREAINVAQAERIGHGVDVVYEEKADELLKEMANKHIMVEINLTSNDAILGVKGKDHPLPLYLHYNVPVALSTDDEGVLRTNLTEQYHKAVLTYHFSYSVLKKLVRNSIYYSFLPGRNLWEDPDYRQMVAECTKENPGSTKISEMCRAFLSKNEKASLQWTLENRFAKFESQYK